MKKKIVIISTTYPYGSHETFLENEIKYLSEFFDIHVIPLINEKKNDEVRDVPNNVSYSPPILNKNHLKRFISGVFNLSPLFQFFPELINIFRNSKKLKVCLYRWYNDLLIYRALLANRQFVDCLNSPSINAIYFFWGMAPAFLLKTKKNIFIRVHGGEIYEDRNFGYITFKNLKFISRTNIIYLPVSEKCKTELLKVSPNLSIQINRLGVYNKGLNPMSLGENKIRLVSCSTLIPLKRVHLIFEAIYKIENLNIEWIHFGDGPLLEDLKQKVSTINNNNISIYLKGREANDIILKYYSEVPIDLFINVSETEGVPVSIMEALSFGIPCFATDVGGTAELIDNNVGKIVKKDFDSNELSQFVFNLKNKKNANILRDNARKRWEMYSNAIVNYSNLVDILNSKNGNK